MKKLAALLVLLFMYTIPKVWAQGVSHTNISLYNSGGTAKIIPHANITVCAVKDLSLPCTTKVTIYADSALSVPLVNPFQSDVNGNYNFFVPPTTLGYTVTVTATGFFGYSYQIGVGNCAAVPLLISSCVSPVLQTNSVTNSNQQLENFVAGPNITLTNVAGITTISSSSPPGVTTPAPPQFSVQYNNPLGTFAGQSTFVTDSSSNVNINGGGSLEIDANVVPGEVSSNYYLNTGDHIWEYSDAANRTLGGWDFNLNNGSMPVDAFPGFLSVTNVAITSNIATITYNPSGAFVTIPDYVFFQNVTTATFLNFNFYQVIDHPTANTFRAFVVNADYSSAADTGQVGKYANPVGPGPIYSHTVSDVPGTRSIDIGLYPDSAVPTGLPAKYWTGIYVTTPNRTQQTYGLDLNTGFNLTVNNRENADIRFETHGATPDPHDYSIKIEADSSTLAPAAFSIYSSGDVYTQSSYGVKATETIGACTHTVGVGLNDCTSGGTLTSDISAVYTIIVQSAGTPDTWSWSASGTPGQPAGGNIFPMTGGAQTLERGVKITWGATTGHTVGDQWTITVTVARPALYAGVGSPEAVVTAVPGSLYMNDSGGAGTSVYLKQSGTGNTGWSAIAGVGGGTVTQVNTTGPLTGGPITTTGTIACATCVTSAASLTSNLPMFGAGSQAAAVGTVTGNTTEVATWTGATTSARCVHTDASGNLTIAAADCGTGGSVTSVATSAPLGGGPITVTGTITCTTCTTNAAALTLNMPLVGGGGQAAAVGTVTGNTTQFATWTGATTASRCVDTDASGNLHITAGDCSTGGSVTSVATTGPITGGPITVTGTIACATCVVATAPGAGIAHFAGATQTVTSSLVALASDVSGQLPIGAVGSAGLSGTAPIGVASTGVVSCPTCTITVAHGTVTFATAMIPTGSCAITVTVAATGTAAGDGIVTDGQGDISGIVGYNPAAGTPLTILPPWPTTNNVNYKVCNYSASNIIPGVLTLNWRVVR